ncbi:MULTISPECIES: TolC family outer membrane protein [Halomonadaceae]|uniref:TolC family outer membrane protein n=1 Tax=Halomonadaceae TaxID=28256 RepID=UPI00159AB430|nr:MULTISPECIES: TolC family outer membrane protein [Halomonas]QJQ96097.1 TolC family outer membrane protein [Halomonas sp. PA5]
MTAVGTLMLSGTVQAADLLTVTRDALLNDATLASAQATYRGVEAGRGVQRGALLPQISLAAEAAHNRAYSSQSVAGASAGTGTAGITALDDNYNSAGLTLEASQALFNASRWYELERADRQLNQQEFSLQATEQQLLFDAASAYFEILRASDILEARQAQERAIERQLSQSRQQFEVGLIAITEVDEAEAVYDLARAERIAAQSDLQVSFEALERLTGLRYPNIDGLTGELPIEPPQPADRDQWVEMAMIHSPLLLLAQAGVEISRSDVDIARAQRMPILEAFAAYQYADSDSDVIEGHDSASQVGMRASLPLYTGGATSASINQSTFVLESTQYDAEAQRRDTVQQVRSLFTRVSNDVETVEARRQAVVSNQSALNAARSGYEVGTRNIVDVLNAEQNLYDAISAHANARYDYVLNLLGLRQQAGTLDVEAITAVNEWLSDEASVSLELPEASSDSRYDAALDIGARPQPRQ